MPPNHELLSTSGVGENWHRAFSAGDVDAALLQHAPWVELIDLGREHVARGTGEVALWLTAWRVGFPDARYENVVVDDRGGAVATTAILVGTHEGPWMGVHPTGRTLRIDVTDVLHFTHRGLVTRHFLHFDLQAALDRLTDDALPHR